MTEKTPIENCNTGVEVYEDKIQVTVVPEAVERVEERGENGERVSTCKDYNAYGIARSERQRRRARIKRGVLACFKFVCCFFSFVAIFFGIGMLGGEEGGELPDAQDSTNGALEGIDNSTESDFVGGTHSAQQSTPVLLIDESMSGVVPDSINTDTYSLSGLIENKREVKIIIVHSHASEKSSALSDVVESGNVLAAILESSGIEVYHETRAFDEEGRLGAYDRMNAALGGLLEKYTGAVCVIDLHDSDTSCPVTFTVGTQSGDGWQENLVLALAVCRRMESEGVALRILPVSIGQNHSRLSLHIGVGSLKMSEEESRAALAAVAEGVLRVCISSYN